MLPGNHFPKAIYYSCELSLCNSRLLSYYTKFGTTVIESQASKLYTKKVNGSAIERGVSFPVCISVNDVVCNHSPLSSEDLVSLHLYHGCRKDEFFSIKSSRG